MRIFAVLLFLMLCTGCRAAPPPSTGESNPLELPPVGHQELRILSPTVLELEYVSAKPDWDFTSDDKLPKPSAFEVKAGSQKIPVKRTGFRRRVLYAPLKQYDLRIGNHLYLELEKPLPENAEVTVSSASPKISPADFKAGFRSDRIGPALHVSQAGYAPDLPKRALIGAYLGSMGEMKIASDAGFDLIDAKSGKAVFHGALTPSPDAGFPVPAYGGTWQADFSDFKTPGFYRLSAPGLGRSFPFPIDAGVPAALARAYALGFYHQRCGAENALPFTRFTHGSCHTDKASVPTMSFRNVQLMLAGMNEDAKADPKHTAPRMQDTDASLYPFVNEGSVDVSGGHHDAGDYSKYTINSAQLIHHLVFAADAFPGVAGLDNLGLPESGDGKSDILQEAKWEADFLARMQDADGGFYFLVYPKERPYEIDVLPDHGDPQVVFPKNTAATAAATAALAQAASSPAFKKQFPEAAAKYLEQARKGWAFLEKAWAKFGRQGAYQKLTHYGNFNQDQDEIFWAAAELYLATGEPKYNELLVKEFDPSDRGTWQWTWWSMFESYGCAIRSYAFAEKSGRMPAAKQDAGLLAKCKGEVVTRGWECARDARGSAYNVSYPHESKRHMAAGWFFPNDFAFDITAAYQLQPGPELVSAVVGNWSYEAGCNPSNIAFIEGLGFRRQHEIVHQYAQNDRRDLPPSGIPVGSIQAEFAYFDPYKLALRLLNFPADDAAGGPYPMYDRWADAYNVTTEFTVVNQAKGLAALCYWMAQSPLKGQAWKPAPAKIVQSGEAFRVEAEGLDAGRALIWWETGGGAVLGPSLQPRGRGDWIEVEAVMPDGRRWFAVKE